MRKKKGHIGANCKVKSAKGSDGRSSKDSGRSSGKVSQDGKPSSKGSGKGKKGKMFEVTEGDGGIFENSWNGFCSFHACHRMFHVLLRYPNGFQGCCSR